MRQLFVLFAGLIAFSLSNSLQAARVLPFEVWVNGKAALYFWTGDQGELDENEVWQELLTSAVFEKTAGDFKLTPDETNGSRITLRGDIQLRMKYGGAPVSLDILRLTRVARGENRWAIPPLERQRK